MARRVLIVAAVLGGCFDPTYPDCATTCSTSDLCPDGLTCTAGYCRIASATGSCGGTTTCPPAPMMQCGAGAAPQAPGCFVLCTGMATDGVGARAFKLNTWHLAVLDDPAQFAQAKTAAGGTPAWIALGQATGQTSPGAGWQWKPADEPLDMADWATNQPDDGDRTEDGTEQCASITSAGWADETCTTSHALLISP